MPPKENHLLGSDCVQGQGDQYEAGRVVVGGSLVMSVQPCQFPLMVPWKDAKPMVASQAKWGKHHLFQIEPVAEGSMA